MPTDASRPLVVAIDGPAGSGKSTLARRLAAALGWPFLDTGAMYRAVTWRALRDAIPLDGTGPLARLAQGVRLDLSREGVVRVDGEDVTEAIRTPRVNDAVSRVAAIPEVRGVMKAHQRRFAAENGRIVAEGRDMGTAVFPDAAVKVFLQGDEEERVRRRVEEMRAKDPTLDPREVRRALLERDRADRTREADPLRMAPDAVPLDTSHLTPDEVLARVLTLVRSRIPL